MVRRSSHRRSLAMGCCQAPPEILRGEKLNRCCFRPWDSSQLLQQAEEIGVHPVFRVFAVDDAEDAGPGYGYLLARWSDSHERARVLATQRDAGRHFVSLGDHIVDDEA